MTSVNITADALVVLRADKNLSARFRFNDSTASWFITEQGKAMAAMAQSVDPAYVDFNMTRYQYFQYELAMAFNQYEQILVLGAGYDTRAIRLAQSNGGPNVFEVDLPQVIDSKKAILAEHGLEIPQKVKLISADLADKQLRTTLQTHGFNPTRPTFVMIEGVIYFLPTTVSALLLDPSHLGLTRGSRVVFDFWCRNRIDAMNKAVKEKIDKPLFHPLAAMDDTQQLLKALDDEGYKVKLCALEKQAREKFASVANDPVHDSWHIVDAQL